MQQIGELLPNTNTNKETEGISLKTEVTEQVTGTTSSTPNVASVVLIEPTAAPRALAQPQLISMPVATTTSAKVPMKPLKRKLRLPISSRKPKSTTLLARPTNGTLSTIRPHPAKPVLISNAIAPLVPKPITTVPMATAAPVAMTYLVLDGNQGRLVQVANDHQLPVTFQNEQGQILQATPINVLSSSTPTNLPSFTINSDCPLVSNASQTVTTVRTSSSIDLQQKTMLTSDTTMMTTQQSTGIFHPPIVSATILNPRDTARPSDPNLSLSLTQLADRANQRHRRSSSSSYSRKKRGRPRLYERDPFAKASVDHPRTEKKEVTVSNLSPSAAKVLIPTTPPTPIVTTAQPYNPMIYPTPPTSVPLISNSPYSYPSLLNHSNLNLFPTPPPYPSSTVSSYSPIPPRSDSSFLTPMKSLQIPTTSSPSPNQEKIVHYIGGYIIRESRQSSPKKEKENATEQRTTKIVQCQICQAMDIQSRFFDAEGKFCSKECSIVSTSSQIVENHPLEPVEEAVPLPPDYGLPQDPNKWTVAQVGEFIARLTNGNVRDAFCESEMDGQALLLMTPEHLRDTMKIKLGPSLIISSEIAKLRERAAKCSA